jgi:dolichyl-phosphate beta-glucosyltransferase
MSVPELSIIIPAYNESRRLPATLTDCSAFLATWGASWELIVVDDGSDDETAAVVARVAAGDPRVRVMTVPHAGKGSAVRRGMLAARGRWRFCADADLSMDLHELYRFFEQPVDVAIGSREAPGARRVGEPTWRHVIGRVFNWWVRLVAVRGVHDTQCGYKLFSERAAVALFGMSRLDGFAFDVEVLYLARRSGMSLREVPITWRYRRGTRVRPANGIRAFAQILRVRWNDALGRYDEALTAVRQAT